MIVNVVFPNGGASQSFDFTFATHGVRGSTIIQATNGAYTIDTSLINLGMLLDAGFLLAPTVCTTATRPNSPYVGQEIFDTTLNIPVWRSAAGTWINASGSTV